MLDKDLSSQAIPHNLNVSLANDHRHMDSAL